MNRIRRGDAGMQGTVAACRTCGVAYKKHGRHAGSVGHAGNRGGGREQGRHAVSR